MFERRERGNGLSLSLLDFEACDFHLKKQPQMLSMSPHSQWLELSESWGNISCQCMCPALINANESCVHEEKGQPLCLWRIGFHSKELGSNLTYNFNWVWRPQPVSGSLLRTPKSSTQQHILWHYQFFRIVGQGTNPPSILVAVQHKN